jgi:hypothetical protein
VTLTEASQRGAVHALLVEIPTMVAAASSPDPSVGEGGLQANLDTAVGVDARSLEPKAAKILLEAVAATWEVHRLREILLSVKPGRLTTLRSFYHKKDRVMHV